MVAPEELPEPSKLMFLMFANHLSYAGDKMASRSERISKYYRLDGRYLKDAEELFKKKDYSQASEKY